MSELDILFPIPTCTRNADDMGMPAPRQPLVWNYDLQRQVNELQEQRDKLLDATKYALMVIAEHNAGGGIETPQQLRIAQQKLFNAVSDVDPGYYGIKKVEATL